MYQGVISPVSLITHAAERIVAQAEMPCTCDTTYGNAICTSCNARWYIMQELYGIDNATEIALEFASDDAFAEQSSDDRMPRSFEIDAKAHLVKIHEGIWVPIERIEEYVHDEDELNNILEMYCSAADEEEYVVPSLERPD